MAGPLQGIRVVEMAGIGPGPFAAMLLADMGAEVIRVQAKGGPPPIPLLNTKYDVLARGRRSMAIDLKAPGAREVVLDLIAGADALVEGFRPGVMERLGLGPDDCHARNPALAYGRMTGWGQDGPLAQRAGHDIDYIALTGVLNAIGPKEGPPAIPLNLVGDFTGGQMLAYGLVCAVLSARTTGAGQVVDAAMTDGTAQLAAMIFGFKAGGLWTDARESNFLDGGAHFYATYACADGKYMAVGAIEPPFYRRMLEILGLDGEPAFENQMDAEAWPDLKARMAEVFRTRPRDEWAAMFEDEDACVAPVLDWDEAMAHPHNAARGTFTEVAGVPQPAPAPRFSRTEPAIAGPPAAADADTEAILNDWGIAAERIAALRESGAI